MTAIVLPHTFAHPMFVRRTQTRSTANGEPYFTHRLVCSIRTGARVRQRTLLNLGRHFALPQSSWTLLCSRVEQILSGQHALPLAEVPRDIEQEAQRIAAQLLTRQVALPGAEQPPHAGQQGDFHNIDVDTLELLRPRSVGVEQVALWAIEQMQLIPLLKRLGFNGRQRAAAVGSIIGRMAAPGSERATYRWLCRRSALGELLEVDFESMSMMQLYRVSDLLDAARKAIENHLFDQVSDLFGLDVTVTLYDLSNTYFEGVAAAQPLAQHGHSKEKRTDCPLLTLGLVVDGSGFVRRSEVLAGNIVEGEVLQGALKRLQVPAGALIVMDCGAATEKNLNWLREQGYRYLVVSRERKRQFDEAKAVSFQTASRQQIQVQKVLAEDASEVRLYCYSPARESKEQAMLKKAMARFEQRLAELHAGLSRPRTHKKIEAIWETDRAAEGNEQWRRTALSYRGGYRQGGQQRNRDQVAATPGCGVQADPSGGVLPAQQSDRLAARDDVADLHHADRPGGSVSFVEVGVGATPDLSPEAASLQRAPVHHRARLSVGAGDPAPPRRAGRTRIMADVAQHSRRPATGNLQLSPR